jgi:23S rRNA pseudouridine1911/1915/1917 synthase
MRLKITAKLSQRRLDLLLMEWLKTNRSQAGKLIKDGQVKVDGKPVKPGFLLKAGQVISYSASPGPPPPAAPKIVYQDDALLVVEKPAGLAVHPASRFKKGATLADFSKSWTSDESSDRPGIVHRLDKDTSGLLIIAKSAVSKAKLQRLFADRQVEKEYLALVKGRLPSQSGVIKLPIGSGKGAKRAVDPLGRPAETRYQVVHQYAATSLVKAWPKTGRSHQLRVHFAAIGHPIIGDKLYGQAESQLGRHFLHAHKLHFWSPVGQMVEASSDLPKELEDYLKQL